MTDIAESREISIASEGNMLAGRFFPPVGPVAAHLVLHGATGVPARYYRAFATWAARQGIGVLTYDYRDFGASRRRPMRESRATMADWGVADQMAAPDALEPRYYVRLFICRPDGGRNGTAPDCAARANLAARPFPRRTDISLSAS